MLIEDELFYEKAYYCASELINLFEPDAFISLNIFDKKSKLNKHDANFKLKNEKIRQTLRDNNKTSMQDTQISSTFFEEHNKLNYMALRYKHRTFLNNNQFFDECCVLLLNELLIHYSQKETDFYNYDYCQSILRNAASKYFTKIIEDITNNRNEDLFSITNELSLLTYEKSKTNGTIYFLNEEDIKKLDITDYMYKFIKAIDLSMNNLKLIRKYLELTDSKIGLISDGKYLYGVSTIPQNMEKYSVEFKNGYSWQITGKSEECFFIKNNRIIIKNTLLLKRDFENVYKQAFSNCYDSKSMSLIYSCLKKLQEIDKGTILVISNRSEEILDGYKDLSTIIEPFQIDSKKISKMSSIDGAIFVDEKANCLGFGAILDGTDTTKGNPARGSRYNSSQRFYNYYTRENPKYKDNINLLVFVLSDDGNYDIFPEKQTWSSKILEYICDKKGCSLDELRNKFKALPKSKLLYAIQKNIAMSFIKETKRNGIPYYEPIIY